VSAWTGEGAFALYGAAVGAVLGAGLTWIEGGLRRRRERSARARYLAVRVLIAMDRFLADTAEALRAEPHPLDDVDPETFAPLPEAYREPQGVDWSSIDDSMAYELLSLPERDREARVRIGDLYQYDTSVRHLRDELFSRLALDVDDLAERVRREYGIAPQSDRPDDTTQWLQTVAKALAT
jgi:hypothetical protein